MKPIVVKLGGSTANAVELALWADALGTAHLPVVIVPGGGPFADQVRLAQSQMGFSDSAAHAMAILAMEQFGHVILDGRPSLVAAAMVEEIEHALAERRTAVWMPSTMALAAPEIQHSWDITSDSLAAWLAGRLGAATLVLIKQSSDFSEQDTPESLRRRGIVDAAFARTLPQGVALRIAGPADAPQAKAALTSGKLFGTLVGRADTPVRKAG